MIVVARNQRETIAACLESVLKFDYSNYEVVVVDDCSTDGTAGIIGEFPVRLHTLDRQAGPALGRNRGAEVSSGEVLLFLDSDVIAAPHALSEIVSALKNNPSAQAVQGVYSTEGVSGNTFTLYKEYFEKYKTQGITSDLVKVVATYCFAIKRKAFLEVGGFDARITGATVEDNDLGYRLCAAGHRVILDRNLKVTHLKKYSLSTLLKRDYGVSFHMLKFFLRSKIAGIPLASGEKTNRTLVISVLLAFTIFVLGILWACAGFAVYYLVPPLSLLCIFVLVHSKYLLSLSKAKGWRFCLAWTSIFYLDMLSASFGLLHGGVDFFIFRKRY